MDFSILTRRIGPLPGWAWGGILAAGVWWFFLRGKTGSTSPTTGAATTPGPDATYGLGFAQGQQAVQASLPQQATAAVQNFMLQLRGNVNPETGQAFPGSTPVNIPLFADTQASRQIGTMPISSSVSASGAPVQGTYNGRQVEYYPVPGPGGSTAYILAQDVAGIQQGGIGGPTRKHAIGSRARAPEWHDSHPLIGAPVRYAHYVRAVGGPGNHRREVARVARQAGVHPARVAMLNPQYTGRIRVA